MKLTKDDFRKLQQEWYEKLQEQGFKDIEKIKGDDLVLSQSATYCFRNVDEFTRELKAEYFRCLAQWVHDEQTVFKNKVHKYILTRHAEGAKGKEIVNELVELGHYRCRNSICFIIRKYEMAWGIRSYNLKELNVKKKA